MSTDTNQQRSTDGVVRPIDEGTLRFLERQAAEQIDREGAMSSFMVRAGLLRDILRLTASAPELYALVETLASLPIGGEIIEDRDLCLYANAGRCITVGDVLDARALIAKAGGRNDL